MNVKARFRGLVYEYVKLRHLFTAAVDEADDNGSGDNFHDAPQAVNHCGEARLGRCDFERAFRTLNPSLTSRAFLLFKISASNFGNLNDSRAVVFIRPKWDAIIGDNSGRLRLQIGASERLRSLRLNAHILSFYIGELSAIEHADSGFEKVENIRKQRTVIGFHPFPIPV